MKATKICSMTGLPDSYSTRRLELTCLSAGDADFIFALVNLPEWIQFIGDRNVHSKEDAVTYIQKIVTNPDIHYWVVRLRNGGLPIGIVTFIKREYLDHPDIGFAFLPAYTKQGCAYEATEVVLNDVSKNPDFTQILATTVEENTASIRLLARLGLQLSFKVQVEKGSLAVYAISTSKIAINNVTNQFFGTFTNTARRKPDWALLQSICLCQGMFIKKSSDDEIVYNLETFMGPRKMLLSDGSLTEFEEWETDEKTTIVGNIAQRYSRYEKKGCLAGNYFEGYGRKFFQFIKTSAGWKISSVVWEDEEK